MPCLSRRTKSSMTTRERMKVGQHMCSIHTKNPEQALASRKPMRTVLAVSRQQFCSMLMLFPHSLLLSFLYRASVPGWGLGICS